MASVLDQIKIGMNLQYYLNNYFGINMHDTLFYGIKCKDVEYIERFWVLLRSMYTQLNILYALKRAYWIVLDAQSVHGCILIPFLFAFFVGELVDLMKDRGCKEVYINEEIPNLMIILYADDIAEGYDTAGRLQLL